MTHGGPREARRLTLSRGEVEPRGCPQMKEEVNQEETLTSWSCISQGGHIPLCPWLIPTWSPGDNTRPLSSRGQ